MGKAFNLQDVKRKFSYQMQAEENIALTNNKHINQFNEIWDSVYMNLMDLGQRNKERYKCFLESSRKWWEPIRVSHMLLIYVKKLCLTMSFAKTE